MMSSSTVIVLESLTLIVVVSWDINVNHNVNRVDEFYEIYTALTSVAEVSCSNYMT